VGGEKSGVLGLGRPGEDDDGVRSIGDLPGPTGVDDPIPLGTGRIITKVDRDWDPLNLTPAFDTVSGTTLADVGQALASLKEWGEGGGRVWNDAVPIDTSPTVTVQLRSNIVFRLISWDGYSGASAAAKAEWDRMIDKLKAHEMRHVQNFLDIANQLAKDLIGKDIDRLGRMVDATGPRIKRAQDQLDAQTNHGKKKNVPFGDVFLDTSIP
jgi:Bacterial protein of unknown function (DUF922)